MRTSDNPRRTRRYGIACPHCGGYARVRTSRAVTSHYRQQILDCQDPDCACSFGVGAGITHVIRQSLQPNPAVSLPQSPPRPRPANDTGPTAANDTGPLAGSEPVRAPEVAPRPANDDDAAQALEA